MGNWLTNIWIGIHWMEDRHTAPGWKDIRQNSKVHSFYWIHSGEGTFITDKPYRVSAGMLFYLKPGLQMSMESDLDKPLHITMVLMSILTINTSGQGMEQTAAACVLPELELPFLMTLQGDNKRSFDNLFLHLTSSWVPGQPAGELRAKAILHELLYEMVELPYSGVRAEGGAEIVKSIKEELERDYASDIRLTAVALSHGISVSYLREIFHRYIGQSPKQYLDQVRYEHAKKRLIYTDLSIKEIGVSCGYADEYHFSKRFKQMNGRPPLAFRKQHT